MHGVGNSGKTVLTDWCIEMFDAFQYRSLTKKFVSSKLMRKVQAPSLVAIDEMAASKVFGSHIDDTKCMLEGKGVDVDMKNRDAVNVFHGASFIMCTNKLPDFML